MDDKSAEIVATCEAAVTWLTDEDRGWQQNGYVDEDHDEDNLARDQVVDYSDASACLGGALVLAGVSDLVRENTVHFGARLRSQRMACSG